jgi:SAM-dependent methyltransferase
VFGCPTCHGGLTESAGALRCERCGEVGRWDQGIACFEVQTEDPAIHWYQSVGGTHFHERTQLSFTMSALDTPVYHGYLAQLKPASVTSLIVDIGAGDGRNTEPWLAWGYQRVVAIDAIASSLRRLQNRLSREHPEWLEHLLFVQCDARRIPLADGAADLVLAIETLAYLNEDYGLGLRECRRILKNRSRLLLSERDWEAGLLTRLFYGGVSAMCALGDSRDLLDGPEGNLVRSRTFTEDELLTALTEAGLASVERKGMPLLSLALGYLRGQGRIGPADRAGLPQVVERLRKLGQQGRLRRTHVVVAEPAN